MWSIDFADGLDLTDEFVVSYILPGEEGIYWGMVGSEITDGTEESSRSLLRAFEKPLKQLRSAFQMTAPKKLLNPPHNRR